MTRDVSSMFGLVRPATTFSLFLLFLYSYRTCQSFQQSPMLLTNRQSVLSPSTPRQSFSNSRKYSAHTHFYADPTSSNVHDQTPPPPSFEQRMRLQLKRNQSTSSTSQTKKIITGNNQLVPDIRDLKGYKEVLDKAGEDGKMLAVLWYSPWCRACKATMPGIRTLAKRHPNVQFIQVPVLTENASLHQGLDVPSVPYLHLYTPEDPRLVEEKRMTRKRLSGFQKLLCDYERGNCSLEQIVGEDGNGDKIWSTSNPYSVLGRNAIETKKPKRNVPETTTGGVGAAVQ